MSSIDDLKENNTNRVDISGIPRKKTVITPSNAKSMASRTKVDLTEDVEQAVEETPDIHESLAKDILEGEDSPFAKYVENKQKEMSERMATYEQEKEVNELDEDEIIDDESEINIEIGTESISSLSLNTKNNDEDDDDMEENIIIDDIKVDSEDISAVKEEVVDEKSKDESVNVVEEKIDEVSTESVKDKEEVEVEAPDIDLNVTNVAVDEKDNELDSMVEEDDESENDVDQEDVLKALQKMATERLKPISRKLDISSYTIMKKPTANIKSLVASEVKAAKWVIPTQDSIVLMKEFLGSELENLREFSEDNTSVSLLYKKYKMIYDHIVSPKPATYDAWLKSTPFADIDHYFFAVYIASFKGANYLPMDCANKTCGKTFLTEDVPIMDMVKFADEKSKAKFVKLYESEAAPAGKGIYCSEIVPLSNKIAIGFKDASVYSLFEIASLSDKDKDKFSAILEFIPYIDALYIIHEDTNELEPIGYKIFPDNANKTVKSKIITFNNTLKNLTVDEFTIIRSYVREITSKSEGISYRYPSVECPYCKTATTETAASAEQLVFTRYQIAALANTSLS